MWKCAEHTEAVEMDGEWVVMDAEKFLVTKLNEEGGWIYSRLQAGDTLEAIVQAMAEQYDISPGRAEADILAFVGQLVECGLVEHVA